MAELDNVATFFKLINQGWNAKNLATIQSCLSSQVVTHAVGLAGLTSTSGVNVVIAYYQSVIDSFPDFTMEITDDVFYGRGRLSAHVTYHGTNSGPFLGYPATNKPVAGDAVIILGFGSDGKIVDHWDIHDLSAIYDQLGWTVSPPRPQTSDLPARSVYRGAGSATSTIAPTGAGATNPQSMTLYNNREGNYMNGRNALIPWGNEHWDFIKQVVADEARKSRVAASVLPIYDVPLGPGARVVPTAFVSSDGTVDDALTAPIVEIYAQFTLSREQLIEEGLSSALDGFRLAANTVGRGEDWIIFNGQYTYALGTNKDEPDKPRFLTLGANETPRGFPKLLKIRGGENRDDYTLDGLFNSQKLDEARVKQLRARLENRQNDDLKVQLADDKMIRARLGTTNPGGLGLRDSTTNDNTVNVDPSADKVVEDLVSAVAKLEDKGHVAPFYCVLGADAFIATYTRKKGDEARPKDTIEPILGHPILRSSALDKNAGVVFSLAGEPINIAVAVEPSPQFLNIDNQGQYHFRVVERFALRVKDPTAIVRLQFQEPPRALAGQVVVDPATALNGAAEALQQAAAALTGAIGLLQRRAGPAPEANQ